MDVALQPDDGKIVVAGKSGSDWAVARYLPDGTPDADFGAAGVVKTDFDGGFDAANAVAVDAEGRIVVGGNAAISPPAAASRTTSPSPGTSRTVIPTRRSEAATAWSRPMSAPTAISATTSPSTPTAGSCWSARSTRAAAP